MFTYYRIWIPKYAIVTSLCVQTLQKEVDYVWVTEDKTQMTLLGDVLCNFPALKKLEISNSHVQIVVEVDI